MLRSTPAVHVLICTNGVLALLFELIALRTGALNSEQCRKTPTAHDSRVRAPDLLLRPTLNAELPSSSQHIELHTG